MEPQHRDAIASDLADELAPRIGALSRELVRLMVQRTPAATGWSREERARIETAVRRIVRGFVRYLRIGDLEVHDLERLRRLLGAPLPRVPAATAEELVRGLRMDTVQHLESVLGRSCSTGERRVVDRELESFLRLLQAPRSPLSGDTELRDLDTWLARIAEGGADVGPPRTAEGTGPPRTAEAMG